MRTRNGYLRGLTELRTLSGLNARKISPHTGYMKITSLELEKLRLSRVRENARRRITEIDARCEEIEAEKAKVLAAISDAAAPSEQVQRSGRVRGMSASNGLSLRY